MRRLPLHLHCPRLHEQKREKKRNTKLYRYFTIAEYWKHFCFCVVCTLNSMHEMPQNKSFRPVALKLGTFPFSNARSQNENSQKRSMENLYRIHDMTQLDDNKEKYENINECERNIWICDAHSEPAQHWMCKVTASTSFIFSQCIHFSISIARSHFIRFDRIFHNSFSCWLFANADTINWTEKRREWENN